MLLLPVPSLEAAWHRLGWTWTARLYESRCRRSAASLRAQSAVRAHVLGKVRLPERPAIGKWFGGQLWALLQLHTQGMKAHPWYLARGVLQATEEREKERCRLARACGCYSKHIASLLHARHRLHLNSSGLLEGCARHGPASCWC